MPAVDLDKMLNNNGNGASHFKFDDLDEILDCGDDILDFEQTAFMSRSKLMLSMIDNMLVSIDERIDAV